MPPRHDLEVRRQGLGQQAELGDVQVAEAFRPIGRHGQEVLTAVAEGHGLDQVVRRALIGQFEQHPVIAVRIEAVEPVAHAALLFVESLDRAADKGVGLQHAVAGPRLLGRAPVPLPDHGGPEHLRMDQAQAAAQPPNRRADRDQLSGERG